MPELLGQALAATAFCAFGLLQFYRYLALQRLCACASTHAVALGAAARGVLHALFAATAIALEAALSLTDTPSANPLGAPTSELCRYFVCVSVCLV